MISKLNKNEDRKKRHARVRLKVSGTAECPRLSVYRSLNHIYAQLIDDTKGVTLVACSTVEKDVMALVAEADKKGAANIVGKELHIIDSLNIFENGPENLLGNILGDSSSDSTFSLDFTALTDTKKVKIRKQVNGKGYLARAKFINISHAKYRITNYAFVSHNKNTK